MPEDDLPKIDLDLSVIPFETLGAAALNFGAAWFNYLTKLLEIDPVLATAGHRRLERFLQRIEPLEPPE